MSEVSRACQRSAGHVRGDPLMSEVSQACQRSAVHVGCRPFMSEVSRACRRSAGHVRGHHGHVSAHKSDYVCDNSCGP